MITGIKNTEAQPFELDNGQGETSRGLFGQLQVVTCL